MTILKAPFVYFGGKSKVAADVWQRLGDPPNFVEPFFGSGAVLLGRPWKPGSSRIETVNDASGYVANFWRAVACDPDAVAMHADYPVNECDLHARHYWLVQRKDSLAARLEGDPEWFDAKIAGWWAWGMSCWIGSGFCSGAGPWHVEDGLLVRTEANGQGVKRQLPHLGKGQGVNRKLPHLGGGGGGRGVHSNGRRGLYAWMQALANRLRRVRVCCGDWSRAMGPSVTFKHGLTGVFLDPPYSAEAGRNNELYEVESATVAHDVRAWCLENGDNPLLRIALCGYTDEGHEELERQGWERFNWKAAGGFGSQGNGAGRANAHREAIWFSPHCLKPQRQASIFDLMGAEA